MVTHPTTYAALPAADTQLHFADGFRGTPVFAAPELMHVRYEDPASTNITWDSKMDVYSFGRCIDEMMPDVILAQARREFREQLNPEGLEVSFLPVDAV